VYFENLQKKDPFLAMPEDFVMCGTFTRERGKGAGEKMERECSVALMSEAARWLI
jgi:hypothetical protein